MTKSELIEKYVWGMVDKSPIAMPESIKPYFHNILTRLLEAYDASKPVEGWHLRLADKLLTDKQYIADMPITRESLAALIAQHAPKGVDVEQQELLIAVAKCYEVLSMTGYHSEEYHAASVALWASYRKFTSKQLALAAQGEK